MYKQEADSILTCGSTRSNATNDEPKVFTKLRLSGFQADAYQCIKDRQIDRHTETDRQTRRHTHTHTHKKKNPN